VVTESMWQLNLYRWLIGLFAGLALVLATVGLYGVISFGTASRLREFAVRLALGSDPGQLIQLVLTRGLILGVCGIAAGLLVAVLISPSARVVSPALAIEPWTLLAVAIVLVVVAGFASVVPALRAARIDPAAALRTD
jgi:putative ABC transport system permease protein